MAFSAVTCFLGETGGGGCKICKSPNNSPKAMQIAADIARGKKNGEEEQLIETIWGMQY